MVSMGLLGSEASLLPKCLNIVTSLMSFPFYISWDTFAQSQASHPHLDHTSRVLHSCFICDQNMFFLIVPKATISSLLLVLNTLTFIDHPSVFKASFHLCPQSTHVMNTLKSPIGMKRTPNLFPMSDASQPGPHLQGCQQVQGTKQQHPRVCSHHSLAS